MGARCFQSPPVRFTPLLMPPIVVRLCPFALLLACLLCLAPRALAQPASFTTTISTSTESVVVNFGHYSIRSPNFNVLV